MGASWAPMPATRVVYLRRSHLFGDIHVTPSESELLRLAPERWRGNPAVMMALGAACLVLAGCRSDQPQQQTASPTPPSVQPKTEAKAPTRPASSRAEETREKPKPTVEDHAKLKITASPLDAPLELWTGKRFVRARTPGCPVRE